MSAAPSRPPALRSVDAPELSVGSLMPAHSLLALRPPQALIEGVVAIGHVGAIAGEYGTGKTFLALDLARAVALSQDWLGAATTPGLVVIIEADSPASSLVPRLLALEVRYPGLISAQRLHFLCEPLLLANSAHDLLTRVRDLEDHVGETVRLLIIDSVTATMPEMGGGALGGMDAARSWVTAARVLTEGDRRAVVGLAHIGKDTSRGILGSVALPAGLDFVMALRAGKNGETLVTTDRQRGGKARDWPACQATFRLAPERGSVVVEVVKPFNSEPEEETPRRKAPGASAGLLLSVAKVMATSVSGRRAKPHEDWPLINEVALLDAWRVTARQAKPNARVTPDIFNRLLKGLCDGGWLGQEEGGVYVA